MGKKIRKTNKAKNRWGIKTARLLEDLQYWLGHGPGGEGSDPALNYAAAGGV